MAKQVIVHAPRPLSRSIQHRDRRRGGHRAARAGRQDEFLQRRQVEHVAETLAGRLEQDRGPLLPVGTELEVELLESESVHDAVQAIDEGRFEKEIIPVELDVPAPDDAAAVLGRQVGADLIEAVGDCDSGWGVSDGDHL